MAQYPNDEYADPAPLPTPAEERLRHDWFNVLNTPSGRAVILDLLRVSHYGMSAFSGKDNDTTNMIAGKQKVGEAIMEMMNFTHPNAFIIAIKEAKELEENDRANASTEPGNG